jgi:hypothetical protein
MPTKPMGNLRRTLATWAVPCARAPAVGACMVDLLAAEKWDPDFVGQRLETYYFDTQGLVLRAARWRGNRYLTLRLRCYDEGPLGEAYALAAKTEDQKFRTLVKPSEADAILAGDYPDWPQDFLLGDLLARFLDLVGEADILPVVKVCCRRFAVEASQDRLTLDVDVTTDTGKCLPSGVLEFKSTDQQTAPPQFPYLLRLRPMKLSKFLWATDWR